MWAVIENEKNNDAQDTMRTRVENEGNNDKDIPARAREHRRSIFTCHLGASGVPTQGFCLQCYGRHAPSLIHDAPLCPPKRPSLTNLGGTAQRPQTYRRRFDPSLLGKRWASAGLQRFCCDAEGRQGRCSAGLERYSPEENCGALCFLFLVGLGPSLFLNVLHC